MAWRRRFGFEPASGPDRAAAFLLHDAFLRFAFRWREEAVRIRSEASEAPSPALHVSRAASAALLRTLRDEPPSEVRDFLIRRHEARLTAEEAHGVPDDRLPAWYFLAQPENRLYREAFDTGP